MSSTPQTVTSERRGTRVKNPLAGTSEELDIAGLDLQTLLVRAELKLLDDGELEAAQLTERLRANRYSLGFLWLIKVFDTWKNFQRKAGRPKTA